MEDSNYEMPRSVRRKLAGNMNENNLAVADLPTTAANLSVNVLANIFGFLPSMRDILCSRCVCSNWKEAAKYTTVPYGFYVWNTDTLRGMQALTTALPNLQQLTISSIDDKDAMKQYPRMRYIWEHRFIAGDNPDDEVAIDTNQNYTTHDINIISNFKYLRKLEITRQAPLNGEYPVFFNFPFLQTLDINEQVSDDRHEGLGEFKWDLKMLEGLPMLRSLYVSAHHGLTGNVNSLRVLKDTLESISITECYHVVGNFMDLADFPRLNCLDLRSTRVTGDIRDISENDFKVLKELYLPRTVYGGNRYAFQTIAEVPGFMRRIYPLAKRMRIDESWRLSKASPDFYDDPNEVWNEDHRKDHQIPPPFVCELFTLYGTRMGWRWTCSFPNSRWEDLVFCYENDYFPFEKDYVEEVDLTCSCEINWLEPEPDRDSSDYEEYIRQLRSLQEEISFFRGYHNPPTEEEYNRLRHEHFGEHFGEED